MSKVTVFSKPACGQCEATKRHLNKLGVEYDVVDLTQDPESLARVKSMGHSQAPVVEYGGISFAGFQPDLLNELAENVKS